MNEEEAKTKWCPMARLSIMDQPIDGSPQPKERCIASDCMMWVWAYDNKPGSIDTKYSTTEGRCGLVK